MNRKAFVGVDGVARLTREMYVGAGGIARRVIKGYVGVNGIARLFYWRSDLATDIYTNYVYPLISNLPGITTPTHGWVVARDRKIFRYTTALVQSSFTGSLTHYIGLVSAKVGNYVIYAGGVLKDVINALGVREWTANAGVAAYHQSTLVATQATAMRKTRSGAASASVGNYTLICGGSISSPGSMDATVDAYNTSLVRSAPTDLGQAMNYHGGATVGNYAVFLGARTGGTVYAYAYNASLVRTVLSTLSLSLNWASIATGVSHGDYALMFIDYLPGDPEPAGVAYNASLVRTTLPPYVHGGYGFDKSPRRVAAAANGKTILLDGMACTQINGNLTAQRNADSPYWFGRYMYDPYEARYAMAVGVGEYVVAFDEKGRAVQYKL